jgi:dihydrofolate synthase/folylpolyglutamate synthase
MSDKVEYERCLKEMFSLRRFGIKLGLDTIRRLLRTLGSPEQRFRTIHVAGTNGKGSVASALATILQYSGFKTGLFTSPHLIRFNERIRVNGMEISDREVVAGYRAVKAAYPAGGREPTFFEVNAAMALAEFARREVDWAVVETGMGGRLDATNVLEPALSIITNISVEHKAYLGGTVAKIAAEKAGIVKPGVPVITGVRQKTALQEIEKAASRCRSPVYLLGRDFSFRRNRRKAIFTYKGIDSTLTGLRTGLAGAFQTVNAALACAASETLRRQGVSIPDDVIYRGLAENRWPGRLEKVSDRPLMILDGAHNLAAARALAGYLATELTGRRITLVCGVLDDKPYEDILADLCPKVSRVILTRAKIDRALPTEVLEPIARRFVSDVKQMDDVAEAVAHARETTRQEDVIVVAGSLYVVGEAKAYLDEIPAQS